MQPMDSYKPVEMQSSKLQKRKGENKMEKTSISGTVYDSKTGMKLLESYVYSQFGDLYVLNPLTDGYVMLNTLLLDGRFNVQLMEVK